MDKKKVLVVDDELDMRIFISTVFETGGYEAFAARDGKDGLAKARKLLPDLIVLDIMMPGEGGVLMYRHLKSDADLKHIPVLMLSGVGKQTFFHYLKMMNIQPDDAIPEPEAYVEKPPNPDELLEIAETLIRPAA
ncbi:response regulator transcription factor [Desulfococcus sp.]|uniref:response regulator transcription factor n=1 Tax=Desulfococcus sp. TaxID=2025834 RepID=UPI0035935D7E